MFIKISKCPHCRRTLDAGINEPLDDPLGQPGQFNCPSCHKPISNGKIEWEDMSIYQKSSYVFRCLITVVWVSALTLFLSVILFGAFPQLDALLGMKGRLDSPAFILFALCIVGGISFWVFRSTTAEIAASRARTTPAKSTHK
jgi:hypothetical protein